MFSSLFKTRSILFKMIGNRSASLTPVISRLKDKVAIVTASTEGIGLAIAQRLAQEGAKVVISSRKPANVEKAVKLLTAQGLNVHGVKCHVGSTDDRQNLFKTTINTYGGLDILVSNAAVNPFFGNMLECSEDAWDKIFDINVKASFLLARDAVPLMQKRGGGSIVFISSIAGYRSFQMLGPYSVSKTALLGLSKTLSDELGPDNIRVNCVAPGVIETKFAAPFHETEGAQDIVKAQTALKRIGQPAEIAGVVSFLVSDDASYVTGENIVAAGGMPSKL